ncbi:hypothetical protein ACH5RR_018611 [Cinchona calisaya]|uniref:Uncharacterized protein n=1 Tax=Cinchona calisaya TaxID=153742 RepID=A0ABD2ZPS0_9GENT
MKVFKRSIHRELSFSLGERIPQLIRNFRLRKEELGPSIVLLFLTPVRVELFTFFALSNPSNLINSYTMSSGEFRLLLSGPAKRESSRDVSPLAVSKKSSSIIPAQLMTTSGVGLPHQLEQLLRLVK